MYSPTLADIALGDLLRGHWAELARTGRISALAEYEIESDETTVYVDGGAKLLLPERTPNQAPEAAHLRLHAFHSVPGRSLTCSHPSRRLGEVRSCTAEEQER